jgi:hypothetical protein
MPNFYAKAMTDGNDLDLWDASPGLHVPTPEPATWVILAAVSIVALVCRGVMSIRTNTEVVLCVPS